MVNAVFSAETLNSAHSMARVMGAVNFNKTEKRFFRPGKKTLVLTLVFLKNTLVSPCIEMQSRLSAGK